MAAGLIDIIQNLNKEELQAAHAQILFFEETTSAHALFFEKTIEINILVFFEDQFRQRQIEQSARTEFLDKETIEKLELLIEIYKKSTKAKSYEILQELKRLAEHNTALIDKYRDIKKNLADLISKQAQRKDQKGTLALGDFIARCMTPDQGFSDGGENELNELYLPLIPETIQETLNLLHNNILKIVNKDSTTIKEKISLIVDLYKNVKGRLNQQAKEFLYPKGDGILSIEAVKITLNDGREISLKQCIEENARAGQASVEGSFFQERLVNTYVAMCFQYINTKTQSNIMKQAYKYRLILRNAVQGIFQEIQTREGYLKMEPSLNHEDEKYTIKTSVIAKKIAFNLKEQLEGYKASIVQYRIGVCKELKILRDFCVENKKEAAIFASILKIIPQNIDKEKDTNRLIEVVDQLHALLFEKSENITPTFKLEGKSSEKRFSSIVSRFTKTNKEIPKDERSGIIKKVYAHFKEAMENAQILKLVKSYDILRSFLSVDDVASAPAVLQNAESKPAGAVELPEYQDSSFALLSRTPSAMWSPARTKSSAQPRNTEVAQSPGGQHRLGSAVTADPQLANIAIELPSSGEHSDEDNPEVPAADSASPGL